MVAEVGALVIAVWALLVTGGWILAISCVFGWLLLALAVIDWRHFLLPDVLTISLLIVGLVATSLLDAPSLVDHFAGAIAGFLILVGIATLYRRIRNRDGIGFGDAKLLGAIGAWVSWEGIPSVLMLATVMGLSVAAVHAIAGTRIEFSTKLPFGTLLAGAGWLVWLYGPLMFGPA